jgi:hypothetical protein
VDFCLSSPPTSLGKPFIVIKTVLDCVEAIRELTSAITGIITFSQPKNHGEKSKLDLASMAAGLALTGDMVAHPVPPLKGAVADNVNTWIRAT